MGARTFIKEKLWPFLVGVSSALIMVLAFFIPSLQDQWDRYQSRKVISHYVELGNDFYKEERYDMAEQAYQKAFELSDSKRLDIEIKRLDAKINRVNMNPKWGAAPPEDLEEIDFQYLLHLQKGKDKLKERVATLNSYGIFLAASQKQKASEQSFKEAIQLDTADAMAYVNLGNLYDQEGKKEMALAKYLQAVSLDKDNSRAHYNLGLLYLEKNQLPLAEDQFKEAVRADSADTDALTQYNLLLNRKKDEK
jgi:tetratricopeptide (TPR) repeat protein